MLRLFLIFSLFVSSSFCLQWVNWKADLTDMPKSGVIGGYESGAANYIIRARHKDGLYPGKFNAKTGKAVLSINGNEVEKQNFELLLGGAEVLWTKNLKDERPSVRAGYTTQGQSLFICRAWVGVGRIPGRLQDKKCIVSQNGLEKEMKDFEALKLRKA